MVKTAKEGTPLYVWRILFKDGDILLNRVIATCGQFVVISCGNDEDTAPSWYPIDAIKGLEGVRVRNAVSDLNSDIALENIMHSLFPPIDARLAEKQYVHVK